MGDAIKLGAFELGSFFAGGGMGRVWSGTHVDLHLPVAIKVVTPEGNVSRVLRRPFTPRAVTRRDQAAERDRQLEAIDAREASSSGSRGGRIVTTDGSGGGGMAVKYRFKRLE